MDCAKCSRELNSPKKTVKCSKCDASYHPSCTRLKSVEYYKKMNMEARSKWECDRCKGSGERSKRIKNKGDESDSDDSISSEDTGKLDVSVKYAASQKEPQMVGNKNLLSVINKLSDKIDKMHSSELTMSQKMDKIDGLVNDLADVKKSIVFMSEQFDSFCTELKTMREAMKQVSEENRQLKEITAVLKVKVDFLEQNTKRGDVVIDGIPETINENCLQIVQELSKVINVDVAPISAFRIGLNQDDKHRKILANLGSESARIAFVASAKKMSELKANSLIVSWPDHRIYVNENLTQFRRELLRKTKLKAKEKNIKFVWVRNFNIYTRKQENEKVVQVRSEDDLLKL
ncbi:hypothetical protein GE061_000828 [Apolygus lucorum]|uniref:PHD-type domain-containing protein n=1 Tax=Apolygus lucorum TaxID=248454 RepID=A0A8S9Y821_APOLU|nr:hypothetical protein GE061_000828 [Apolygus lucorum]